MDSEQYSSTKKKTANKLIHNVNYYKRPLPTENNYIFELGDHKLKCDVLFLVENRKRNKKEKRGKNRKKWDVLEYTLYI